MDQLMVQVDEGGSRPCGVEGESLVEVQYGEVERCWWLVERKSPNLLEGLEPLPIK